MSKNPRERAETEGFKIVLVKKEPKSACSCGCKKEDQMNEEVYLTKKHYVIILAVSLVFLISCVYGYFLLKEGQKKQNCWDLYTTEQEAILHCEGVNQ